MEPSSLRDHPFLRALGDEQLALLSPCARELELDPDAFVFREGGEADTLYLLRSGCVALEQHVPGRGVVTVESLCAGDILGLSWLFPGARWTLDARCNDRVRAIAFDAEALRNRMKEDQGLAVALLTRVALALYQRLVRVRLQRLDVYTARG